MQVIRAIEVERRVRVAGQALAAGVHEVEIQRELFAHIRPGDRFAVACAVTRASGTRSRAARKVNKVCFMVRFSASRSE